MQTITVKLPQNPYEIAIAPGSLNSLGSCMSKLKLGKKILVVSSDEILDHYSEIVFDSLRDAGFEVFTHNIRAGEKYKTLKSVARIYNTALKNYLERSSTLVALGGGVIGDMTGFAAATWLRGVNFVQVPTTLLAMVDASIGGKTGVNHPKGKNLIGAFYQPKLVFIDPLVLKTLPEREWRGGMAEVIKYGVIRDAKLFKQLEQVDRLDGLEYLSKELLQSIIALSCQAKAKVVSKDEKEKNLRAILNYGHTIGHAIESLTEYKLLTHGEAVAIGMVAAGKIAVMMNMWKEKELMRQNALIKKAELPMAIPSSLNTEEIVEEIKRDKKVEAGKVKFVLPTKIGKVKVRDDVSEDVVREVVEGLKG